MKEFFLERFENESEYKNFMEYMLLNSDTFSLIYFKYRENEKIKKDTKSIQDGLKKFKIYSIFTQRWPNTETWDQTHSYKFVLYNSDIRCLDILTTVKDIYGWDYPNAPMDLCFYKNGYCWMAITAHEQMAYLYTDSKVEVEKLRILGTKLTLANNDAKIFWLDSIKNSSSI